MVPEERAQKSMSVVGRYAIFAEVAAGGMASIHLGRLLGPVGFARTVAIKRLHPQFAKDPEFVTMFLDEARLSARIQHPNVISPIDVVATQGELFLVMDYVQGESLGKLVRAAQQTGQSVPLEVVRAILSGVLHGLHAAHEAKNERGELLGIVHRDVSPQNVLVGVDGVARVLDFGIAKAMGRTTATREGQIKGKLAYMAPERFQFTEANRKVDIYAVAVVLWETLTAQRLFKADGDAETVARVLSANIVPPSRVASGISEALDSVVMRGLNRDPSQRFDTAREMALALEATGPLATPAQVGEWVHTTAGATLSERAHRIAEIEQASDPSFTPPPSASMLAASGTALTASTTAPAASGSAPAIAVYSKDDETLLAPLRRRRVATIAGSVGLLAVLVIGGAFLLHGSPADGSARAAAREPAPRPPARLDGPDTVPAQSDQRGAATTMAAPEPTASSEPATSAPAIQPRAAPVRVAKPAPANKPSAQHSCDPPYVLDAAGHHHYKVECL